MPSAGPLLAVCGLCGGAGASTLAYLVALAEARRRSAPVLVGDTGGPGGGISCYAGVQAPRSLVEVADHVAAGLPAGQLSDHHRRPAGARDRPAVHARVRARGDRAAPGLRARALRADRDRLRHARPRSRPGRAGERLARRVGAARQRQRDPPRAPGARGDQPLPAGPRADRRPPRRARPRLRCASSSGSPSTATRRWCCCHPSPTSQPATPTGRSRQRRCRCRRSSECSHDEPADAHGSSGPAHAPHRDLSAGAARAGAADDRSERSRTEPPTGTVRLAATVAMLHARRRSDRRGAWSASRSRARRAAGLATRSPASRPARTSAVGDLRAQRAGDPGRVRAAADRPARRTPPGRARRAPSG